MNILRGETLCGETLCGETLCGETLREETLRDVETAHYAMHQALYIGKRHDVDDASLFLGISEPAWCHAGLLRLPGDHFEQRVDKICEIFLRRDMPATFAVNELTEPPDAAHRLKIMGFSIGFRHTWLLATEERTHSAPSVNIREIMTSEEFDDGLKIFRSVYFKTDEKLATEEEGSWAEYEQALRRSFLSPDATHYLAHLQGQAVGFASSLHSGRFCGLYNLAVLPSARCHGIGRALTTHRVIAAQSAGLQVFLLTEREEVANWHLRNGFEVVLKTVGYTQPIENR